MIDITKLTKEDIGKWVEYNVGLCGMDMVFVGKREKGRIKSWNDKYIFVVYRCNGEWDRFQDFIGVATRPDNLEFVQGGKE